MHLALLIYHLFILLVEGANLAAMCVSVAEIPLRTSALSQGACLTGLCYQSVTQLGHELHPLSGELASK